MNIYLKIKNSQKIKIYKNNAANFFLFLNDLLAKFYLNIYLLISFQNIDKLKFLIITASDTSHFKSLCQLLESLLTYCKNDKVVVYDLGLKNEEIDYIRKTFETVYIKHFDFSSYPSFINLKEKDAGAYAWKPIIIHSERQISNLPIIWMDAGNLVFKNIDLIKIYILKKKFYSPYSSDTVKRWTHQTTLKKLKVSSKVLKKRNMNAALIGFNNDQIIYNFILKWKNLSLEKDIIIPAGSNKSNHRWDQSLLTILYYQLLKFKLIAKTYKIWGIKIHQDID